MYSKSVRMASRAHRPNPTASVTVTGLPLLTGPHSQETFVHIVKQHATRAGTQAVERAFAVLRSFTDQERVWALAGLSRKLGLARPTTLRLLGALEREGMVQRTGPASLYRLGPRAIQLGALAQRSNELPIAAQSYLEELSRLTGETASLEVLADHEIMVLAEVRGRFRGSASERVGARWPAHAAATGKVLLAAALL